MRCRFLKTLILCLIFIAPLSVFAEMNGLLKWFLFSDKAYASQIEVKAYILTEQQSADLLANPSVEPIQLIGAELSKSTTKYLVVRVKNLGNKHAWGTLACTVRGVWNPIKIPIISIERNFCSYLICLAGTSVAYSHETFGLAHKFGHLSR